MSKSIPKAVMFEYNVVQIDGVTPGGCLVCPTCKEPAYEKDGCVFCGQAFLNDTQSEEIAKYGGCIWMSKK